MMITQQTILRPQQVSKYLGIDPTQLSRQTAYTIGSATIPPHKRGAAARYSPIDAVLISLGQMLIGMGLMPHRARQCTARVRGWLEKVLSDPRYYMDPRPVEFTTDVMMRWLMGKHTAEGFDVELVDKYVMVERLSTDVAADPQVIVSLYHWIGREMAILDALEAE